MSDVLANRLSVYKPPADENTYMYASKAGLFASANPGRMDGLFCLIEVKALERFESQLSGKHRECLDPSDCLSH